MDYKKKFLLLGHWCTIYSPFSASTEYTLYWILGLFFSHSLAFLSRYKDCFNLSLNHTGSGNLRLIIVYVLQLGSVMTCSVTLRLEVAWELLCLQVVQSKLFSPSINSDGIF
jgi:hypothetical protein